MLLFKTCMTNLWHKIYTRNWWCVHCFWMKRYTARKKRCVQPASQPARQTMTSSGNYSHTLRTTKQLITHIKVDEIHLYVVFLNNGTQALFSISYHISFTFRWSYSKAEEITPYIPIHKLQIYIYIYISTDLISLMFHFFNWFIFLIKTRFNRFPHSI